MFSFNQHWLQWGESLICILYKWSSMWKQSFYMVSFVKQLLLFFTKHKFWSDSIVFNTGLLWTNHSPSFVLKALQWISQELKITFPSLQIFSADVRGPSFAQQLMGCVRYFFSLLSPSLGRQWWTAECWSRREGVVTSFLYKLRYWASSLPGEHLHPGGSIVSARKVTIKDQQAFTGIF